MYNLVVLDGKTLNPGDLNWEKLKKIAKCTIYDRTSEGQLNSRIKDAQIILTNKVVIDDSILEKAKNLEYIVVTATGYNIVDVNACKKHGVIVSNVPAYSRESVVQHVFSLILEIAGKVGLYSKSVKRGDWQKSNDFSYQLSTTFEISGKTIGVIGYGSIGRRVVDVALAFGMNVLVYTRTKYEDFSEKVKFVELNELLHRSDIITIHTPLTNDTKNLITLNEINKTKEHVVIINTARGGIINEEDLALALNEGRVLYAGIDVLMDEPPVKGNPLIDCENSYITPHIAWATIEARERLMNVVVENVKSFIVGDTINRVDM